LAIVSCPSPSAQAAAEVGATVIEPVFSAGALIRMAAGADPIDPVKLAPLYPREAEAVTQWRRLHPPA
jgi:hypothetical protein